MPIEEILLVAPDAVSLLPLITEPLQDWYYRNKRSLPWRDEPSPYRIWVSEIMLQQTRVEAVRDYFWRFISELPDIPTLASVPDDVLLKLWEGLGYYSRARNMKKAARILVSEYGGMLPASYEALRALPGIGDYTAGAIASIAFGIPVPAVDGNVLRVLARQLGSYADISRSAVKKAMREAAFLLLPEQKPGDLNQALMELGATVCLPYGAPRCSVCPVASNCAAYEGNFAREIPVKAARKERRIERRTVALLIVADKVLLLRRGGQGLLANLYEPLNLETHLEPAQVIKIVEELGARVRTCEDAGESKHVFSHVEWDMKGYAVYCEAVFPLPDAAWADWAMIRGAFALPSAFHAYRKQLPALLGVRQGENVGDA